MAAALLLSACGTPGTQSASSKPTLTPVPSSSPRAPVAVTLRVTVGRKPCGILGAAGVIWISNYGDDNVVRLDPISGRSIGQPALTGRQPCGLAAGGGSIWTADYGGNSSTRIDQVTGQVLAKIPVGGAPYDVTFAAGAAWVTNYTDGTVSRIDPAGDGVTTISVGQGPAGIAPSAGSIWVATQGAGPVSESEPAAPLVVRPSQPGGPPRRPARVLPVARRRAGQVPLRPILLTPAAMRGGMTPLALGLGEGGETQAPMGRAIIGGVITSTLLTLVVVPVIYTYLDKLAQRRKAKHAARAAAVPAPPLGLARTRRP